jgi:hypothetical protein
MSRMVRKQVYISAEQDKLLKRRAKALGVTEAEVVRRGIELASSDSASLPFDRRAWEEELRFIRERAGIQELGKARGWTREELYEERFARHSR